MIVKATVHSHYHVEDTHARCTLEDTNSVTRRQGKVQFSIISESICRYTGIMLVFAEEYKYSTNVEHVGKKVKCCIGRLHIWNSEGFLQDMQYMSRYILRIYSLWLFVFVL